MFLKEFIFNVIGGLGLFIYGIHLMSEGLQKACGDKMRRLLAILTTNPLKGTLIGAGVTAFIQSSSATTVMTIGFVNAGLMTLAQAIGVIFGANIGTTITAQLIAFRLTDYALPILGIGFGLNFFVKRRTVKFIGQFLLGFGLLFLGLSIMTSVAKPLGSSESVRQIFINFSQNPLLGILAGMVVTMIVQSSSVTVGLVLALATVGLLDLRGAIPLILGDNIGTCITAALASIGGTISARRTAVAHIGFNIIGTGIVLLLLPVYRVLILHTSANIARQVANAHSLFNIMNTVIFLPFVGLYARFLTKLVKGKEEEEIESAPKYLEQHLLNTPSVAIEAATKEIIKTLKITQQMVKIAMEDFFKGDPRRLNKVAQKEETVDALRLATTNYLVELMQRELSPQQSAKIPALVHIVNDVERIGDHAENLKDLAEQKIEGRMPFSNMAISELKKIQSKIDEMINLSIQTLELDDRQKAEIVLEKESYINNLRSELKQNHIKRLEKGTCNVLSGVVFLDAISNFEKIGDHLTNIAQAVAAGL